MPKKKQEIKINVDHEKLSKAVTKLFWEQVDARLMDFPEDFQDKVYNAIEDTFNKAGTVTYGESFRVVREAIKSLSNNSIEE